MPIRVPVREMKDTAKFGKLVEESNWTSSLLPGMTAMPTRS